MRTAALGANGCHIGTTGPSRGSVGADDSRRPSPGALSRHGYLPDEGLSTAVFLALTLQRPLLLEGEAGVGKTELAKSLADRDRRRT